MLWGLAQLHSAGHTTLAYTDLDLTYPLDQIGLHLAGDDLLLRDDGGSDLADLAAARTAAQAAGALAAATVPGHDAQRYGILQPFGESQ